MDEKPLEKHNLLFASIIYTIVMSWSHLVFVFTEFRALLITFINSFISIVNV